MGCEYTIHVGELPIVGEADIINKMLGNNVVLDTMVSAKQPHIDVGSCSFLGAGMSENNDEYIPKAIQSLTEIIPCGYSGKTVVIDDDLIDKVRSINWENGTNYYKLRITMEKLIEFLKKHMNKPCYTICW